MNAKDIKSDVNDYFDSIDHSSRLAATEATNYIVMARGDGRGVIAPLAPGESEQDALKRLHALTEGYAPHVQWTHTADFFYRATKRLFNIIFSAVVVILLLVPGLLLSIFIMFDTKGSPIYVSRRVGYRGKKIGVFKFRSMVADANNVEKYLSPAQLKQWKTEMKVDDDPRITRIGHFIRKTSIDELPQFLNVLFGQMSVVGPRPITRAELEWFGKDADKLLTCHPGITGLWQVTEHNNATYQSGLRQKIELAYVDCRCLRLDFKIIFGTFGALLQKREG